MKWEYIVLQCWGLEHGDNFFLGIESYGWDADPPDPSQGLQDEHEYDVFYYINKLVYCQTS